jgi:hypothetical protein
MQYSTNAALFASDFAKATVKLGNISPLTGKQWGDQVELSED